MNQKESWEETTLADVVIDAVPTEDLYGYDHTPPIPSDRIEAVALYIQVSGDLYKAFTRFEPVRTLAALSLLQTTARTGSRPPFLDMPELEFAQAMFVKTGGGPTSPSLVEITKLCNDLCLFRTLFLSTSERVEPNTKEWSLQNRRQETLNVRNTHFWSIERRLAELITSRFGSRAASKLGFTLAQASQILFSAADFII